MPELHHSAHRVSTSRSAKLESALLALPPSGLTLAPLHTVHLKACRAAASSGGHDAAPLLAHQAHKLRCTAGMALLSFDAFHSRSRASAAACAASHMFSRSIAAIGAFVGRTATGGTGTDGSLQSGLSAGHCSSSCVRPSAPAGGTGFKKLAH